MTYDAGRDLSNRTVRAAIMDFLLTSMRSAPDPTNPLPHGPTPKIVVEGFKDGRTTTDHAITLSLAIKKAHQRLSFAVLAEKFSIDHLPSDKISEAVTQELAQIVVRGMQGDPEATDLLAWLREQAATVLQEAIQQALPGPVVVTMSGGLPVRVRRIDG